MRRWFWTICLLTFSTSAFSLLPTDGRRMRERLDKIRSEILNSEEAPGFWHYQEAYLQHHLEGTEWAIPAPERRFTQRPTGWTGSIEMVTGMAAIEESLQLSVLRNGSLTPDPAATIPISELKPPEIKSHDFAAMRKNLPPGPIPNLSRFSPADSLFIGFGELTEALAFTDQLSAWQTALSRLSDLLYSNDSPRSFVQRLGLRLSPELRPFYGLAVGSMALVVDDPYLAEGADLSLILEARSESVLDLRVAQFDQEVLAAHPGLAVREETYQGHPLRILHSADGSVRSYRCAVGPVRIFSSSRGALQRVLDAVDGRLPRLADTDEFAYIRSVLPGGQGFLYISDACVRKFVSPAFKLAEQRRVRCLGALRVLDYAMDLAEMEKNPQTTLDGLVKAGYLGEAPSCPQEGFFLYDESAGRFRHSVYGTSEDLARLSELPIPKATEAEASDYRGFVENYSVYWPRYFDPIGIELSVQDGKVRLSSCILPLIESSTYNQLKDWSGGAAGALAWSREALAQVGGLFSFKMALFEDYRPDLSHIKDERLRDSFAGLKHWVENALPWGTDKDILSWVGSEGSFVLFDSEANDFSSLDRGEAALRISVVDAELAEHLLRTMARFTPAWWDPIQSEGLPAGVRLLLQNKGYSDNFAALLTQENLYLIWGAREQHSELVSRLLELKPVVGASKSNVYMGLNLERLPKMLAQTSKNLEQMSVARCARTRAKLEDLGEFPGKRSGVGVLRCVDGGVYSTVDGEVRCSIHGSRKQPVEVGELPASAPLRKLLDGMRQAHASLTFTEEGVRTSLEVPVVQALDP